MKIGIIGTGYVGLITGVCFAKAGHEVICFDKNKSIIDKLSNGSPHIHEKGLNDLLIDLLKTNLFKAKLLNNLVIDFDIIIIAVGTPSKENGEIDLKYIKEAAAYIGKSLKKVESFVSIIIKSTVLPGTTDTIVQNIIEKESSKKLGEFGLGMNPEFLREGNAIEDFSNPDRIVMGYEDEETLFRLEELYKPWSCDKIKVNTRTAEMIKYANNSILATQISMVNELANITTRIGGIDIEDVLQGVYKDKRWSPIKNGKRINPQILSYLKAGCGFGGSCLPKDIKALEYKSNSLGLNPIIINSVIETNKSQPLEVINILNSHYNSLSNRAFLILGLAFKPETDDIREAISLKIISYLQNKGCSIIAHDPIAIENCKQTIVNQDHLNFTNNWEKELSNVDGILILTEWSAYLKLSNKKHQKEISKKVIFDARRMFNSDDFPFSKYLSIGRNL